MKVKVATSPRSHGAFRMTVWWIPTNPFGVATQEAPRKPSGASDVFAEAGSAESTTPAVVARARIDRFVPRPPNRRL